MSGVANVVECLCIVFEFCTGFTFMKVRDSAKSSIEYMS